MIALPLLLLACVLFFAFADRNAEEAARLGTSETSSLNQPARTTTANDLLERVHQ